MDLIPGMGSVKLPKEALQVQQEKMVVWKYIMNSCTQAELEDPAIISAHRIDRISSGAGTKERDVRDLLKHYKQSKKMMRAMKGVGGGAMEEGGQMNEKQMQRMMKKMGGMQKLMKGAGR
jgi:signal recognition particle subunit SRP54